MNDLFDLQERDDESINSLDRSLFCLVNFFRSIGILGRNLDLGKWKKYLIELNRDFSEDKIREVSEWFVSNYDKCSTMEIRSVLSFKINFVSIVKYMAQGSSVGNKTSAEVDNLYNTVVGMNWPNGTDHELKKFISVLLVESERLVYLFNKFLEHGKDKRLLTLCAYVVNRYVSSPIVLCRLWLSYVNKILQYTDFGFEYFQLSLASKRFIKMGCNWSFEYCHDSQVFIELINEIKRMK